MSDHQNSIYKVHELLENIIQELIASDAFFEIHTEVKDSCIEYVVAVEKEVAGRLIGKHGDVIKSIRTIIYSITMFQHQMKSIILIEPY